jgi:hypothetical protein
VTTSSYPLAGPLASGKAIPATDNLALLWLAWLKWAFTRAMRSFACIYAAQRDGDVHGPVHDRTISSSFLRALAPDAHCFTFQTFTDPSSVRKALNAEQKRDPLARLLQGSLEEHWDTLIGLSAAGAGAFVLINENDGRGRKAENIVRVRAYFVDLDGAPLNNLTRLSLFPHLLTHTSPERYHAFYRVADARLDQFKNTQVRLAKFMDADPSVCDLPRVMRLPGLPNMKAPPGRSQCGWLRRPRCRLTQIKNFRPLSRRQKHSTLGLLSRLTGR